MNARARIPMSFEDYLRWEARQEEKWEYVRGEPVLRRIRSMSGGTFRHALVALNLLSALNARLGGGPCAAVGSDFMVKSPTGNSRYPDVTVECGRPDMNDLIADKPTIVAEVLSPSNDEKEMKERLADYQAILSAAHVAFVEPGAMRAKVWSRRGEAWLDDTIEGPEAILDFSALGVRIPLVEAYTRIRSVKLDGEPA